jgi:hypothetical protein
MKLFKVFNGYYGSATISVLVLAEDRAKALKLARSIFRVAFKNETFLELQTELIFDSCDVAQCSGLMEFR